MTGAGVLVVDACMINPILEGLAAMVPLRLWPPAAATISFLMERFYTVTLAGLDRLERDLTAPRSASHGTSEEAQRRESARRHGAPEPLGERPQRAEEVGSIVALRGERDRLLQEIEEQRLRIERLEAELGRRCTPRYERLFG